MAESIAHKRAKKKAAGSSGETEVALPGKKRLDARNSKKATEVERSGSKDSLEKAVDRLSTQKKLKKELVVPEPDIKKAVDLMREKGVKGTGKNMTGTKRTMVKKST
jgi:hypothetical protein